MLKSCVHAHLKKIIVHVLRQTRLLSLMENKQMHINLFSFKDCASGLLNKAMKLGLPQMDY